MPPMIPHSGPLHKFRLRPLRQAPRCMIFGRRRDISDIDANFSDFSRLTTVSRRRMGKPRDVERRLFDVFPVHVLTAFISLPRYRN